MDVKKKKFRIADIPQHVLDLSAERLLWYSTGLVKVRRKKAHEEVNLIGSGTFIKVNDIHGILTAHHVAAMIRDASHLGLVITLEEHRFHIAIEHLHFIDIAKPTEPSEGPDLSFIKLPDHLLGTLKAKKLFFNLSYYREKVLYNPLDFNFGFWMPLGFVGEQTENEEATRRFSTLKHLHMLGGAGGIERTY